MAVTVSCYNKMYELMNTAGLDWANDTIKVMLVDTYTFDATHAFKSDIDALLVEISGTGYTAGGSAVALKTVTVDAVNSRVVCDGDDVSWNPSTITASGAIVYKEVLDALGNPDPTVSPLLFYIDFGVAYSSNNNEFRIAWDATGIYLTAQG